MNAMVIEWSFDCDQASDAANAAFDTVMNRDWLLEHGIHPFDTDVAWEEAKKHMLYLGESSVLTNTKIIQGNATTDEQRLLWLKIGKILLRGQK